MAHLSSPNTVDVLLAGGGPAGLLLAAALVDEGISVVVVTPSPSALWEENHASWESELTESHLGSFLSPKWERVVMIDAAGAPVELEAGYGLVDKERLQPHLLAKIESGGSFIDDRVASVSTTDASTTVTLESGSTIEARFFVDATGAQGISAAPASPSLFQVALGGMFQVGSLRSTENGDVSGAMVLMDWRAAPGADQDGMEPSFLYAMPHGEGRIFFEETILIGQHRSPAALRERLLARLDTLYDDVTWLEDGAGSPLEEHCVIPMNVAVQRPTSHAVFGAAAGAIHPATGYSIGWSARHAPAVASVIAEGLAINRPAFELTAAVNETLWSKDAKRSRQLLSAGAKVLVGLSPADVSDFFAAFFAQKQHRWMPFMTRSQGASAILSAMWATFRRVPFGLKMKMMRLGVGPLGRAVVE